MVIQELKPSQRIKGRWLAVLEDGSILRIGENQVVDFALYTGKELSEEEAEALQGSAQRQQRKEKALELLARKPQSRWELEKKLAQWGAEEDEVQTVCDRMEQLGYLNDAEYAARVVRHYSAKGFGPGKLRDELYRRGVPRDLWQEAMDQAEDPAQSIDAFVAKKLAGKTADRQILKKVSDALARRGYHWPDINDALRRYGAETEEEF
ncbi:MAG: recombination regulator RecX [Clostridiales bacterium]|nr:recombination regulator RecX [Clostridiales bacterium]